MQRSHAHPSCVSRSARWASSSQSLSPTSNEYTLAHSVAGALHCHGGRCRDGPTDSLLPGVKCQTRQLGAQGFWFLFLLLLFLFFCRPGARTPRVSGGALRASAAEIVHTEIVHTYMHMMNSGRSRDPPPYHPGWGGLTRKLVLEENTSWS